jgi:hypothetical protein
VYPSVVHGAEANNAHAHAVRPRQPARNPRAFDAASLITAGTHAATSDLAPHDRANPDGIVAACSDPSAARIAASIDDDRSRCCFPSAHGEEATIRCASFTTFASSASASSARVSGIVERTQTTVTTYSIPRAVAASTIEAARSGVRRERQSGDQPSLFFDPTPF